MKNGNDIKGSGNDREIVRMTKRYYEWHKGVMGLPRRYAPRNDKKDERYEGVMRLPHFLRKFAMTEVRNKSEKKYKGWIPAFTGMTERGRKY